MNAKPTMSAALKTKLLVALVCLSVVQLARAERTLQMLYKFFPTNSSQTLPSGRLVEGDDGSFYGTTVRGGVYGRGGIFKVSPSFEVTQLYSFSNTSAFGGLVWGGDGNLYGTSSDYQVPGQIFRVTTNGVLTNIFTFPASGVSFISLTNGTEPLGPLTRADDGLLYGMTAGGGVSDWGTVFKITTNGVFTTIHFFNGLDGCNPRDSGLLLGTGGKLYGTTDYGGSNTIAKYGGNGTIFTITTNGDFNSLFQFSGSNGVSPNPLTFGTDGLIYGTTKRGGTNLLYTVGSSSVYMGTAFKMTTNGQLTTLVHFNGTNGYVPVGNLVQAKEGALYGMASYSFSTNGTIFKVTTGGVLTTLEYLNGTNGVNPAGYLNLGRDENIYGTMQDVNRKLAKDGNDGGIFRLFAPPRPSLAIVPFGSQAMLSWPSSATNYVLQQNPNLATTNWTGVGASPSDDGTNKVFTTSPASNQLFFRLMQP